VPAAALFFNPFELFHSEASNVSSFTSSGVQMSFAEQAAKDRTTTNNTEYTRIDGDVLPAPEMSYGSGGSYNRGGGGGGGQGSGGYESAFSSLTQSIRKYQEHIKAISRLSKKIGRSGQDTHKLRGDLRYHIDEGRDVATDITSQLKTFSKYLNEVSGQEKNKRRAGQRKLLRDFQSQVKRFEKLAQEAETKMDDARARGSSVDDIPRGSVGFGQAEAWNNAQEPEEHQHLLGQETMLNEEIIAERQEAMRNVHKSVQKVNDIFADLADLVEEQHETIVTIDQEAKDAYEKTKGGVSELDKASEYQKSSNSKMKCILGVIFLCGGIFLVYTLLNK
jgi:t-SNARE complex subunit (syntaxin)